MSEGLRDRVTSKPRTEMFPASSRSSRPLRLPWWTCALGCGLLSSASAAQVVGYALTTTDGQLERLDLGSGESEVLGPAAGRPFSGLAFDGQRRLWTIDPSVPQLVELALINGLPGETRPLDAALELEAPDLTFDPCGRLYVIDRPQATEATTSLYQIDADGGFHELGSPDRRLYSITSTNGRLVALASDASRTSSLVEVDRVTGATYFERQFQDNPGAAWIDFERNGTLWGVDPATDFGPPTPARGWTAAPRLALRTFTSILETATEINGLAIAPPQGSCSLQCTEGKSVHCFQDGQFSVSVEYTDGPAVGLATALLVKSVGSGLFTFFDEGNWEVMVKVLDGCDINGRYWVFSSAATDLPHRVTVTETSTGETKTYTQPAGPSLAINDTAAFVCSDTSLP